MVCKKRISVKDAEKNEWKKCVECGNFICPECVSLVNETMGGDCPSSLYLGFPPHKLNLIEISAKEIVSIAKEIYSRGKIGPIIKSIFYSDVRFTQFEDLTHRRKNVLSKEEVKEVIREEIWRKYGRVLVKRSRGKFITWEPIL